MPKQKVRQKARKKPSASRHADANECAIVTLFVDIMGASEVSNHKSPKEYSEFVHSFQTMFNDTCDKYTQAWCNGYLDHLQYTARGDEGVLMLYPPKTSDLSDDIDIALNVAFALKRRWICSPDNESRIREQGLLPVDLGIGIHVGRTYLREGKLAEGNRGGWRPDGYAINLAKRVEGHSREGRYSHIYLSEQAQGQLEYLADERTYLFDAPQVVSPKGITRDIRVFEVKHQFLPTDWKETSEKSERAKTLLDPQETDVEILKLALELNPTNLWLAEEFVRSSMLQCFDALGKNEREAENYDAENKALQPAAEVAARLAQSDHRDAGILFIQGLIDGERGDFESEISRYDEVLGGLEPLAEAYWYKGQALSYSVWEEIEADEWPERDDLAPDLAQRVDDALGCLEQAKSRRPQCAWILYDLGCELVRWAQDESQRNSGFENIELAVGRLPEVRKKIPDEPHLERVQDDPRIKKLLQTT